MVATEYCPSCNEGIVWKCVNCEKENDRSIHTYHPGAEEISTAIPSSLVGALVCVATGMVSIV
jgi:hypothetical protein